MWHVNVLHADQDRDHILVLRAQECPYRVRQLGQVVPVFINAAHQLMMTTRNRLIKNVIYRRLPQVEFVPNFAIANPDDFPAVFFFKVDDKHLVLVVEIVEGALTFRILLLLKPVLGGQFRVGIGVLGALDCFEKSREFLDHPRVLSCEAEQVLVGGFAFKRHIVELLDVARYKIGVD